MINLIGFLIAVKVDTLTSAYSPKWNAPSAQDGLEALFTAADLWPVVFGVTLIIWAVLITNLYRIEKRLRKLESEKTKTDG